MKEIRYYIDPTTGQPHIYQHNVDESEVEYVLNNPLIDSKGREDSRNALGQTAAGRFLKIIYSPDEDGQGIFVITAYDLTGKPLRAVRRHLRRK